MVDGFSGMPNQQGPLSFTTCWLGSVHFQMLASPLVRSATTVLSLSTVVPRPGSLPAGRPALVHRRRHEFVPLCVQQSGRLYRSNRARELAEFLDRSWSGVDGVCWRHTYFRNRRPWHPCRGWDSNYRYRCNRRRIRAVCRKSEASSSYRCDWRDDNTVCDMACSAINPYCPYICWNTGSVDCCPDGSWLVYFTDVTICSSYVEPCSKTGQYY
jgi:hypothetical protein